MLISGFRLQPLSSECGTCKPVKTRFSGQRSQNFVRCPLLARKQASREQPWSGVGVSSLGSRVGVSGCRVWISGVRVWSFLCGVRILFIGVAGLEGVAWGLGFGGSTPFPSPTGAQCWAIFRIQNSGFGMQGSGFRFQDSRFRVQGAGFRFQGSGLRAQGSGCRAWGFGVGAYPPPPRRGAQRCSERRCSWTPSARRGRTASPTHPHMDSLMDKV